MCASSIPSGFITDLPKDLVNAFRATLEELGEADLMVHVVDASNPDWPRQMQAVEGTLHDLKLETKPRLLVFNKCDALDGEPAHPADALCVSARSGLGIAGLKAALEKVERWNCSE